MTQTEILQLLNLINRFDKEELNCNGNCYGCYYYMESRDAHLDNCPLLVAYDMVLGRFNHNEQWCK
jgi:hypothetical protein